MIYASPAAAFTLRRLGAADAAQYRALRLAGLRAFPHAFRPDHEEALQQPLSWAEQRLSRPDEYWFGAFDARFDDTELVGAICLRTQEGRKIRHSASLNALVVDPQRQRCGIGRALVAHLLAHLLEFARSLGHLRQITLTVIDGNTAAEKLYDAFGFRQFGLEPGAVLHDGHYRAMQHRHYSLVTPTS